MTKDEATRQYLATKEKYNDLCIKCDTDRITNRSERHNAYTALKHAETDLIDICFDQIESKLNKNFGELLTDILTDPAARHMVAELSLHLK